MDRSALDEKDTVIVSKLQKNSRVSYGEIASVLGISDVAVMKRIKKLERDGVIKQYTVKLDDKRAGYSSVSITGVDVEPERLFEVASKLREKDYVKYLAISSGDHQLMLVIKTKDSDETAKYHGEIASMPGVKRVCPSVILDVLKDE